MWASSLQGLPFGLCLVGVGFYKNKAFSASLACTGSYPVLYKVASFLQVVEKSWLFHRLSTH